MMPLCTTAMRPATWGWALVSLGRPWVAQRVCPMPSLPAMGSWPSFLRSSISLPWARRTKNPLRAHQGQTGRVISPVFQATQALHDHFHRVLGTHISNYSAHKSTHAPWDKITGQFSVIISQSPRGLYPGISPGQALTPGPLPAMYGQEAHQEPDAGHGWLFPTGAWRGPWMAFSDRLLGACRRNLHDRLPMRAMDGPPKGEVFLNRALRATCQNLLLAS